MDPAERFELTGIVQLMIIIGVSVGLVASVALSGPLGGRAADAIGVTIIVVSALATVALLVRLTGGFRGGVKGWRRACRAAGLRAVEPRWASVLRVGLPPFEGTIDGRAARAVHLGADAGVVWLFVRGVPRPGWQRSDELRGVVRTEHNEPWIGAAIRPKDVRPDEIRRVLRALASVAR